MHEDKYEAWEAMAGAAPHPVYMGDPRSTTAQMPAIVYNCPALILAPRPGVAALLVGFWLVAVSPRVALANDFDQFQSARAAYESLNYERAAQLFRALLAEATPGDRRPLVLESRKYLAATYMFLRRHPDAVAQFELLLNADHEYVLDPLAFPNEVVAKFNEVKARVTTERAAVEQQRAARETEERTRSEQADRQQREAFEKLVKLAGTETVQQLNSRWVAMVPFGAGQFQNGDNGLGVALAVSEGLLAATTLVTFLLHESLRDEPAPAVPADARLAEGAFRYTNQISFGLLLAIAATGIIDAQVRFKPATLYERPRQLPPDVLQLRVSAGPQNFGISGRF